jgi:hypothetical protein
MIKDIYHGFYHGSLAMAHGLLAIPDQLCRGPSGMDGYSPFLKYADNHIVQIPKNRAVSATFGALSTCVLSCFLLSQAVNKTLEAFVN